MINILNNSVQYEKISDETTIAYLEMGDGPETLLFIHGLGNSMIGWSKNLEYLSQYYKCIAIDLPGNGFSSKNHFPYSIKNFSAFIKAFLEKKKVENCTIIGHSMGGQIAIYFTHQNPQLIKSLVLIAPAGIETFTFLEKNMMIQGMQILDLTLTDENKLFQALETSFYQINKDSQLITDAMIKLLELQPPFHYKKMVNQCVKSMLDENVQEKISEIQCQTLVIFGTMDSMIPNKLFHPATTSQIAKNGIKKFQSGQLKLIPLAGHFVHWEKASIVNELIIEQLKSI